MTEFSSCWEYSLVNAPSLSIIPLGCMLKDIIISAPHPAWLAALRLPPLTASVLTHQHAWLRRNWLSLLRDRFDLSAHLVRGAAQFLNFSAALTFHSNISRCKDRPVQPWRHALQARTGIMIRDGPSTCMRSNVLQLLLELATAVVILAADTTYTAFQCRRSWAPVAVLLRDVTSAPTLAFFPKQRRPLSSQ